jgi:hypothetical protein
MLISTFELLIKPQIPSSVNSPNGPVELPFAFLSRPIIQGYFLTIANITEKIDASLLINFKAVTTIPGADVAGITATLLDKGGTNNIGDVMPENNKAYQFPVNLPANTTCLFIFQPDPTVPGALTKLDTELRGYVDIELAPDVTSAVQLLITPEHRGTFFRKGISNNTHRSERQLGEIAYSLPTASGGSLFTLEPQC